MCGILHGVRFGNGSISKPLLKRYRNQRSRGKEGFGYIVIERGKVKRIERSEKEKEMEEKLSNETTNEILFHHRLPTSTPNLEDMTHPIVVKNKMLDHDYYVVHNGVLQNEYELKPKHESMGFDYTTNMCIREITTTRSGEKESATYYFNDSEVLAIDLALYLDNKQEKIESIGSIAFVCLQTDKKGNVLNIHYGRNFQSPLKLEQNHGILFIKSEGCGVEIEHDILYTMDYKTKQITENDVAIGKTYYSKNTNNYNYGSSKYWENIGNGRGDDNNGWLDAGDLENAGYEDVGGVRLIKSPIQTQVNENGGVFDIIGTQKKQRCLPIVSGFDSEFIANTYCDENFYTDDMVLSLMEEEEQLILDMEECESNMLRYANGDKTIDPIGEEQAKEEIIDKLINVRADIKHIEGVLEQRRVIEM